jgi:hypothetical protein
MQLEFTNSMNYLMFLTKLCVSFFPSFTRFVKCRGITFTQPVHRDKPPQMGHHYLWGSKQLNLAYSTIYGQYTGETSTCCVSSLETVTVWQKAHQLYKAMCRNCELIMIRLLKAPSYCSDPLRNLHCINCITCLF